MRLFIGHATDHADRTSIQQRAKATLSDRAWRIALKEQWHVTLLFLGEVDPERTGAISASIGTIARNSTSIELRDGKLCAMPAHAPRMLWVRFDPDPAFTALHHELAEAIGIPIEKDRAIVPHITIARTKQRPMPIEPIVILDRYVIDHLTLFQSTLDPRGAIHKPIGTWTLQPKRSS